MTEIRTGAAGGDSTSGRPEDQIIVDGIQVFGLEAGLTNIRSNIRAALKKFKDPESKFLVFSDQEGNRYKLRQTPQTESTQNRLILFKNPEGKEEYHLFLLHDNPTPDMKAIVEILDPAFAKKLEKPIKPKREFSKLSPVEKSAVLAYRETFGLKAKDQYGAKRTLHNVSIFESTGGNLPIEQEVVSSDEEISERDMNFNVIIEEQRTVINWKQDDKQGSFEFSFQKTPSSQHETEAKNLRKDLNNGTKLFHNLSDQEIALLIAEVSKYPDRSLPANFSQDDPSAGSAVAYAIGDPMLNRSVAIAGRISGEGRKGRSTGAGTAQVRGRGFEFLREKLVANLK